MEKTGFMGSSEGKFSLGTVVATLGSILGAIALLPPEQLAIFERFLPMVIWPLSIIVAAYTLGRSIVKYAEKRDAPAPGTVSVPVAVPGPNLSQG